MSKRARASETRGFPVGSAGGGWASGQAGILWFFDRGNAEVPVKVLDGCADNGHRWVLVAPVTDLAFKPLGDRARRKSLEPQRHAGTNSLRQERQLGLEVFTGQIYRADYDSMATVPDTMIPTPPTPMMTTPTPEP